MKLLIQELNLHSVVLASENMAARACPTVLESANALKKVEFLFRETKEAIKSQDDIRELYSNQASPTEKLSYPSFSGQESECFQDFEEKLVKVLKNNKVRQDDKVDKLRSCLSGKAESLVPKTQKSFDNAMEALRKAFGDPTRLMRFRMQELKKLGKLPRSNKSGAVVEWFLSLEVIVQSLLDMAKRADEANNFDVVHTLYSIDLIRTIASLFGQLQGKDIIKATQGCSGRARLKKVQSVIVNFRTESQDWSLIQELTEPGSSVTASGDGGGGRRNGGVKTSNITGNVTLEQFVPQSKALVFFKPPKTFVDCRVCKILESKGDTNQLYDNHHSNYATGCPRFICMSTDSRHDVAIAAKFCLRCMDPKYKYKQYDRQHSCNGVKKGKYSCSVSDCRQHLWV